MDLNPDTAQRIHHGRIDLNPDTGQVVALFQESYLRNTARPGGKTISLANNDTRQKGDIV